MRFSLLLLLFFAGFNASAQNDAKSFLKKTNETLSKELISVQRAEWIQNNFITDDTTALTSEANARYGELGAQLALDSKKYRGANYNEKRQLNLLMGFLNLPAPKNPRLNQEMTLLKAEMEGTYGSGKYCNPKNKCKDLLELETILAESRNPSELKDAWEGWRTISVPMKSKYKKVVDYANQGSMELGYKNLSDFWKSKYDMSEMAFEADLDRLWKDIKPLYQQLHCYARTQLNQQYGDKVVPNEGPIPAHVLGNMWGQSWDNIYEILAKNTESKNSNSSILSKLKEMFNSSTSKSDQELNITSLLQKAKYNAKKMTSVSENFFVSLGMPKLPKSFYEKSLLEKPRDREVVCHASAWHLDLKDDVRIKMCIKIDEENFRTIHHELGHIYYFLAYKDKPVLYQGSANDGFHEALGDTIQLSITPKYLEAIGLLKNYKPSKDADIDYLLQMALGKVAFLPFGLMIDKWRWQVFDGRVSYENYNSAWWDLVKEYQGIIPPSPRPKEAFDPGSKYHVPAFVPYSRYFIAHILQFQFHKSLCETAGFKGPLHECSIYNNKAAGEKLWAMMQMGLSQPWPQALKAVTGTTEMDAKAMRDYFAPLESWLKEKNKDQKCGW